MTPPGPPPDTCPWAFKEWAGICAALADGRQSLILRKGGIEEGPGGFTPEHGAFWLYPTHLHEGQQGLRVPAPPAPGGDGRVLLEALAVVDTVVFVDRPEVLASLADLHVWTEETVLGRFHYRRPGLWALGVRVFRRPDPWPIEPSPAMMGCKTWVALDPPPPPARLAPALDEGEFARRMDRLRREVSAP